MPDREKVVKGLECCEEDAYGCCRECPYNDHRIGTIEYCTSALCVDALKLLKEQEETIASFQGTIRKLNAALEEQAEIVRCKDCKRKDTLSCPKAPKRPDDWFCADGKRRETE